MQSDSLNVYEINMVKITTNQNRRNIDKYVDYIDLQPGFGCVINSKAADDYGLL